MNDIRQLRVKYDRKGDVLYVSIRPGLPARSEEDERGLVWRHDTRTGEIIGVTIIDFAEGWRHRIDELVDEIASRLHTPRQVAYEAVRSHLH